MKFRIAFLKKSVRKKNRVLEHIKRRGVVDVYLCFGENHCLVLRNIGKDHALFGWP